MSRAREVNFDGLVGPTHNYSGLSVGNVASQKNAGRLARPRAAALQGLDKMLRLTELGLVQGVLAPHERPNLDLLRRVGFVGTDVEVIESSHSKNPELLAAAYSASAMWTANAATVSPSADTADGRVHFTPANLVDKLHRSIEPETTGRLLASVFPSEQHFAHHDSLPATSALGDEGAANHTRFCAAHGSPGVELFNFGRHALDGEQLAPKRYPARQTIEASQSIARLHGLDPSRVVYAQQNPDVIDEGVFHNDVIAVGNENVLLFHERAFLESDATLEALDEKLRLVGTELRAIEVEDGQVSVADAVSSYLFNSQLVSSGNGGMTLIAPTECRATPSVATFLDALVASSGPVEKVEFLDVRESMKNGGGPACLRLRVVLTDDELAAVNPACLLDADLYNRLGAWVRVHYRETLGFDDLRDPNLVTETRTALDELTQIMKLGSVYPFQR